MTPLPVTDSKCSIFCSFIPFSFTPLTIASATGCSLYISTDAARERISSSDNLPNEVKDFKAGLPSVIVPVLSMISVFTLFISSIALASLTRTPAWAPRPVPTIMDIGVARPRAHGHAIISTETAFTNANMNAGSGPHNDHAAKVNRATPITIWTKYFATTSASFCMGARDRLASLTISMICESKVSEPTFSALITKDVLPFIVPPVTLSLSDLSTGTGSPVIILSSIMAVPSTMIPSTGIFSPGFTRSKLPSFTSSRGISSSFPFLIILATGGTSPSKALMAELVLLCALSSSTWPIKTRVRMTEAASK